MMFEYNHPIPAHSDWEGFKSCLHVLDIIDEVIDRDELGIPDECLPLARGAAIASRYLLRQAHHHGGGRPSGWDKNGDFFSTMHGAIFLVVSRFGDSPFWSIHRYDGRIPPDILVFNFGSTPMLGFASATGIAVISDILSARQSRRLGSRSGRFAVARKPGNAGGGKGPQFKTNARRGEGPGDWATYPRSGTARAASTTGWPGRRCLSVAR